MGSEELSEADQQAVMEQMGGIPLPSGKKVEDTLGEEKPSQEPKEKKSLLDNLSKKIFKPALAK